MRSSAHPTRAKLPLLAALAILFIATIASVAQAQSDPGTALPADASAQPTGDNGTVSSTPGTVEPTGDGALHVMANPSARDPRPVSIDHLSVAADGKTVTVYWYGGVDTCYALQRVDAEHVATGVTRIAVWEGTLPELPDDQPCIDLAMLKATTITLDFPMFQDGSLVGG